MDSPPFFSISRGTRRWNKWFPLRILNRNLYDCTETGDTAALKRYKDVVVRLYACECIAGYGPAERADTGTIKVKASLRWPAKRNRLASKPTPPKSRIKMLLARDLWVLPNAMNILTCISPITKSQLRNFYFFDQQLVNSVCIRVCPIYLISIVPIYRHRPGSLTIDTPHPERLC